MNKAAKMVAAGLGTLAVAGGIGAGIANADPEPTPSANPTAVATASPTASPADKPGQRADAKGKHRALLRRALHGEATLGGRQQQVVVFQRGIVEAVSATSMTLKSEDGFTATYVLNSKTRVRKQRQPATASDVEVKDKVRMLATKDGSVLTAKVVRDHAQ
jgi:hypothetical protein